MAENAADPQQARREFLRAQVAHLDPLGFVVVGLPEPPFDAVQARREEDDTFIVEIASREPNSPFSVLQASGLEKLGFSVAGQTWAAPAVANGDAAVDLVEHILVDVLAVAPDTPVDVRHGTLREERAAQAKLESMRAFVEPVLTEMLGHPAERDADGDYIVDLPEMRVFVAPRAVPGRPPIIRVFAITNAGLVLSPELGLFLARMNFSLAFGRFSFDTDHRAVWFDETLLGDQVTKDELTFVVNVVAETAGEWDDKIAAMFGGTFRGTEAPTEQAAADTAAAAPNKPGQGGYL